MWCGVGNCRIIEEGEACYEPNTLYSHASIAVNQLYVSPDSPYLYGCSGLIVINDPSHGNCTYESYPGVQGNSN
ncbi:O-Glycosyl hydrolase family 17 protein [Trifolium repens]|nr:O-Glycosyl hydrolase family 17 protein [Trifolium repens]